jgi:hypothetical protein
MRNVVQNVVFVNRKSFDVKSKKTMQIFLLV